MNTVEQERDFYRRQCDELGARILRLQKDQIDARRDARRSRTAMILTCETFRLANLRVSMDEIGKRFLQIFLDAMNADSAAIMEYIPQDNRFAARCSLGFSWPASHFSPPIPPCEFCFANSASQEHPFAAWLRQIIQTPYLIWSFNPRSGFALLAGNAAEDQHLHRPFEANDREIVEGALNVFIDLAARIHAERALKKARDEMESRVAERTADLLRVNQLMEAEIAERKRAEAALLSSKWQYRATIDAMGDAIHVIDADYRILLANSTMLQWNEKLGLEKDIIGRTVFDIFPFLPNRVREEYQRVFESGKPLSTEETTRLDRKEMITETRKIPIQEEGKVTRIVTVIRDITEKKKLEGRLLQAQKMEAVGQLAGGVAHDFNNLLTIIIGNVALAEKKASAEIHRNLVSASQAASRAEKLVQQLLAFSRKSQIELKPIALNSIIEEVYRLMRETIDRRIEIAIQTDKSLPKVLADGTQMHSTFMNLCLNARDAFDEYLHDPAAFRRPVDRFMILLKTETTVVENRFCERHAYARPGRFVVVSISDNGIGMDIDTQHHIFEPFFTTKEVGKGTGLGLASVYGIVEQHGGWIDFYSEYKKGTTFKLYLPMVEDEEIETDIEYCEETRGGSETILLVDDEEMILDFGREILEEYGYTVLLAADGEEATNIFLQKSDRIDLLILDLSMPRLSGREMLERLQLALQGKKVIVSSGYAEEFQREMLTHLGAADFIAKPYQPTSLAQKVRQVLDKV
ncbi:MAG: response regulator [Candidatus Omnitrophota bacterium]